MTRMSTARPIDQQNTLPDLLPAEQSIEEGIRGIFPHLISEALTNSGGDKITHFRLNLMRHAHSESFLILQGLYAYSQAWQNLGLSKGVDAQISPEGVRQAQTMADRLKSEYECGSMSPPDIQFVSPLLRCYQTLQPITEMTESYLKNQSANLHKPPIVCLPLLREDIQARGGVLGGSHIDQTRVFEDPFWNGGYGNGKIDLWYGYENETLAQVKKRMEQFVLFLIKTASIFTEHTGKSRVTINALAHSKTNREIWYILHRMAGQVGDDYNSGFFNTEIKTAYISFVTKKDGMIEYIPQSNGKIVKFGQGIQPEAAAEYRKLQSEYFSSRG